MLVAVLVVSSFTAIFMAEHIYIHLNHLIDAPTRIQMLLLKIQPYDLSIKYIPGSKVPMADALSTVNTNEKVEIKGLGVTIHGLHHN